MTFIELEEALDFAKGDVRQTPIFVCGTPDGWRVGFVSPHKGDDTYKVLPDRSILHRDPSGEIGRFAAAVSKPAPPPAKTSRREPEPFKRLVVKGFAW